MSTKKLGRVMWTGNKEGSPIVVCLDEPPRNCRPGRKLLLIDLSDPAALVEKVAKVVADVWLDETPRTIAWQVCNRALGVPAKLLKERKKKPL